MGNRKIMTVLDDYSKKRGSIQLPEGIEDAVSRECVQQIWSLFADVEDYRVSGRTKYPIREILLVTFTSVLCGYTDYEEIEAFGKANIRFFRKFYAFSNGICSHDTFRRAISLINTDTLQGSTVGVLERIMECIGAALKEGEDPPPCREGQEQYRQYCLDGKEDKGSGRLYGTDRELRNHQTLNIYDRTSGICISSVTIPQKTNEVPESQKLLKLMDLKGCIVTFDALNTQKKTCGIIKDRKGHYTGALKENQPSLLSDAKDLFTEETIRKCGSSPGKYYLETVEKQHGQIETRRYYCEKAWHEPVKKDDVWPGLKIFIMAKKECVNLSTSKTATETRFYISDPSYIGLLAE